MRDERTIKLLDLKEYYACNYPRKIKLGAF